jgi:N-dimethylarginine dimethylaminohydrolase
VDIFDHLQPGVDDHSKFVMCRPVYLSTAIPNNVFMEKEPEKPDVPRALNQFDRSVHLFESLGVEVLEIPPQKGAQDQLFTANVGTEINGVIVLANFSAPGRAVEIPPAQKFFQQLGYKCVQPPMAQEGEADLKKWKQGYYFGGWGLFSKKESCDWIMKQLGVTVIPVQEVNPKSFHLDCCLLVVDQENFMVTRKGLSPDSIKTLQKLGNVTFTPEGIETTGCTNGVLIPEKRIYVSGAFNPEQPDYRKAAEWLLETMDKFGYTTVFTDCDSYNASGADLSCSVMHLENPPAK